VSIGVQLCLSLHMKNKIAHTVVLLAFSAASAFVWMLMTIPLLLSRALIRLGNPLPGFSQLCVALRPIAVALPIVAAAYCVWIWSRKADKLPSWIGFFAVLMGVLVLVALPAIIGAYLPLYASINGLK